MFHVTILAYFLKVWERKVNNPSTRNLSVCMFHVTILAYFLKVWVRKVNNPSTWTWGKLWHALNPQIEHLASILLCDVLRC
jgi:5'-deoxynucleotidase YfbR-like HD superfamily hydrolase